MRLTFLGLPMVTCASELRAQTHVTQLQGILQSGMQPNSVQPGAGLGYGTSSASYTGETIRQVQTALRTLGYYHGQIDGQFGPLSQSALQNYQLKTKQPATGLLTGSL